MSELRYDGKVAIITGAGGGLGRAHALLLASRGAKVVVNDLGGGMAGGGKSSEAADRVVAEIKAAGGEAVANYDSVEDGGSIVKDAIDAFGRIDIVVNNAGILRDMSFRKMAQEDWDLVYRVHVLGAFRVTHAAWPHMLDQGYGRIVFTASAAGIYGNFGQANYSMAKLGLAGLGNTLAIEGKKKNVLVNTIAPLAGSRLTETVLPKELVDALRPEYVSPLVAWLCHDSCDETGGLFEVGGGFFGKLRWERAQGKVWRLGRAITPEHVQGAWDDIAGFAKSTHPSNANESFTPIIENVHAGPAKGGNEFIDVDAALGYEFPEFKSSYDERDLALYALAIGAARNPLDDKDLQLVYEMHGEGLKAIPTFGVIPAINGLVQLAQEGHKAPGMNYGLDRILHGEQLIEVKRPLPAKATLRHKMRIKEIWDKGKGAVVVNEVRSFDESGDELLRNELTIFVRGAGGWGGDRGPSAESNAPPERAPDAVEEEKTHENQALLYRLTGDRNPLHADPSFAAAFGFDRPILHGLCTFGFAARHAIKRFSSGDPRFFKSMKARFSESVFPGETIVTEMWKESPTRVVLRCKVKERDKVVLSAAAVELYERIPVGKPKAQAAAAAPASVVAAAAPVEPTTTDIFAGMAKHIAQNAALVQKVATIYLFKLTSPQSVFTVDLKNGAGSVASGESTKADCTLELSDADFMAMCTGKADPQKLYFGGKLKITGNIMASQKLEFLRKLDPALVLEAARERVANGAPSASVAAAPAVAAPRGEPTIGDWFAAVRIYLEEHSDVAPKVAASYHFRLKNPDSAWTVDLKSSPFVVSDGAIGTADCTFELAHEDFVAMSRGQSDPQKLYFAGKLKLSGNVMAAQKLQFITKIDKAAVEAALAKARGEAPAVGGAAAPSGSPGGETTIGDWFSAVRVYLDDHPDVPPKVAASYHFRLKNPDSAWTVDLKSSPWLVAEGAVGTADCTFELAHEDFVAMSRGQGDPQKLYFAGKLKLAGNVMAAQKLQFITKIDKAAVEAALAKARGAAPMAPVAPSVAAPSAPARAPGIFSALEKRLLENPSLAGELGAVAVFKITAPDAAWTLDLAKSPGSVRSGIDAGVAATLTISDEDFVALVQNPAQARDFFQRGKLRVDGDVRVAQRLGFLKGLA